MQFSTKIDGFEQKDSQGFENSHNSYEQYPIEKFFIFTIYQNYMYTLALMKYELCIDAHWPYVARRKKKKEFRLIQGMGFLSIDQSFSSLLNIQSVVLFLLFFLQHK